MYEVIGPDDYPIAPVLYATHQDAEDAVDAFVDRFREQGFYSGVDERIPLHAIAGSCLIMEVEDDDDDWDDEDEYDDE